MPNTPNSAMNRNFKGATVIRIACPECHKKFRVDDSNAGKKAKCPECGSRISIPVAVAPAPLDLHSVSSNSDAEEFDDATDETPMLATTDQAEQSSDDPWDEVENYPARRTPRIRNAKSAKPSKTQDSRSPLRYAVIGGGAVLVIGATLWLSGTFSKSPEHRAQDEVAQLVVKAEENNEPKVAGPEKTSAEWITEGSTALDAGDNEAALVAFSKAIDADNQSAPAFNGRGVAYLRSAKLKSALADFTRSIELKSDEAKFYGNRALVHQDQGNFGAALADMSKAIKLQPQSPQWYQQRALVFSLMDDSDHEKADLAHAETLEKAAKRDDQPIAVKPQRPGLRNGVQLDFANAQKLQAPDHDKKISNDLIQFTSEMRNLASDEFIFKDAQQKLFHSRFDQRMLRHSPLIKLTLGRNTIVDPPKYNFDSKKVSLGLLFFYQHWERRQTAGKWFPEDTDRCAVVTEFELDEATARKWRDAFNGGNLVLDIWFSPLHAQNASWQESPTYTDGRLSHDIVIEVETFRCEMVE